MCFRPEYYAGSDSVAGTVGKTDEHNPLDSQGWECGVTDRLVTQVLCKVNYSLCLYCEQI
jgi:hypothetical protein